jgi:hypothetical protein
MEFLKNENLNSDEFSPLVLAYMGDCVYELLVRNYVVAKGNRPVNHMHTMARSFVNAGSQSQMYDIIKDILTEEEDHIYKRGRNAKSHTKAKNQSTVDYRRATGIEALFGYLYMQGKFDRVIELFESGVKGLEKIKNEKKGQQKS